MKITIWRVAILLILGALVALAVIPSPKRSVPGRIVRFCLGEPGATQGVNDAADTIISKKWEDDLELFADEMIREFGPEEEKLPEAFMGGRLLPYV